MSRRLRDDAGNATLEFTYLAVLLLIPLVYIVVSVFQVQRAAFAVSAAAREAGRAYVTAPTLADARQRGDYAAQLSMSDHDLDPAAPTYTGDGLQLTPGGTVEVRVTYTVELPVLGSLFDAASIPVTGVHVATVDRFRAP